MGNKISDFKKNRVRFKSHEVINLIKFEAETLKYLLEDKYAYCIEEERRPNLFLGSNCNYFQLNIF